MTRNPVGDNEVFSAVYWSAILNAHAFEYVQSGVVPSKGTGSFDVDTTAGTVQIGSTTASPGAQTTTLASADPSDPRVDLITCDATGNVDVVAGTPAANPAAPDIPAAEVLIAAVVVPAGAASISSADIHDYRVAGIFTDYPIVSADIATDAVGAAEIAANAVGSSEIATDAVTASQIAADAVGASEIAANAVGASEIAANAVGNSEMADNAIGSAEIINGSVDHDTDASAEFRALLYAGV